MPSAHQASRAAERMRIVILDDYQDAVRSLAAFGKLDGHTVHVYNDTAADEDALVERLHQAEAVVLVRQRTRLSAALLARLPKLKLVAQTGAAGSHIDIAACTARGILVTQTRGGSHSTAELTWFLILAGLRGLAPDVERMRQGHWQTTFGRGLHGRTLGIWGYGKIGRLVAGYGRAFGMQVQVFGREKSIAEASADGYATVDRAALMASSDVVSLHVRLIPETRGLVTAEDLARMKPDALWVNSSRAELVQPGALLHALRAGRPGYAAVDVYDHEPVLGASDPLLGMANVLCTPHLGYVERDNYEQYFGDAFDNILAYAAGAATRVVNTELLQS